MKKYFLYLLALLFVAIAPVFKRTAGSASAEEPRYSRILSEEVVLYSDRSLSSPWFILPYSYYVRIISAEGRAVKVEYKGDNPLRPSIKGYISSSDIEISDETPAAPYPSVSFTIGQNCLVFKDANFNYPEAVAENSSVEFYGTYIKSDGEKYVYGYITSASGDKFVGYVASSALLGFAVPELPVYIPEIDSESLAEPEKESSSQPVNALGDNLQVVIIVGISVVAISIVYLLFRPSGKAKEEVLKEDESG